MTTSKDIIQCTWPTLLCIFAYLFGMMFIQAYWHEHALLLWLNTNHTPWLDGLFILLTYLGDWQLALIVGVMLIWKKRPLFWIYFIAVLTQLVIVQAVKHLFFSTHLRPVYYFAKQGITLKAPEIINQGHYYHFPSGHSATACVIFLVLALSTKCRWLQLGCGVLLTTVALSRVYLAQHFTNDTSAGILVGLLCTVCSFYFFKQEVVDK